MREAHQWIKELREQRRKEWQHVQRVNPLNENEVGDYRAYPMFGGDPKLGAAIWLGEGGWLGKRWMTTKELETARDRWVKQSCAVSGSEFAERLKYEGGRIQCGGCRFFGALDGDFGLCCNPESPMDGHVTFEHGGCKKHSNLGEA